MKTTAFEASGGMVLVPDGSTGTTMVSTPVDFGATEWAPRWTAPALGEHTDEILAELGRPPRTPGNET